ncbi:hypothetical protein H6F47_18090 [Sphaerospermopsis sp. FACHB-1094]|jgi:hypothetical protein|uniref:hypothetical protein n=1 Tax=Sphaerospermopsis sp. FACHB-1094 TaxID=2692861 RepID=UPI001682A16E|nr:hypothetical protein [Sphaerospermopsis sp. FACHB-1094]MBD2134292.1 hypothetical protein [Sphaerospermopsis sp. FACHB-1094]
MTQQNLLELAKQGDPNAIATLINYQLQAKGILAKANTMKGCLQIIFEATEVPPQHSIANYIYSAIRKLKAPSIKKVIIYGKQIGNDFPAWQQEFDFLNTESVDDKSSNTLSVEVIGQSKSKNTTIYECQGDAVHLIIETDGVLIKRLGGLLASHPKGERFISYKNILKIQFHQSGRFTYGFLYFQLTNSIENISYLEAASNPNAVVFFHDKLSEFEKARVFILDKINSLQTPTYTDTQSAVHPTNVVVQPVIQHEMQISCPKCGSTQITSNKKGFNVGQALVGGVLTGGVGLAAGFFGSNEIRLNCLRCGHRWKPKG